MSLVVVALVLGAFGQSGQVSRHNALFKEQVEVKHENATKMMTSRRQESQKATDRNQRLQKFLKERDTGAPIRLGDTRAGDMDIKMLPEPVVCMSQTQQERGGKGQKSDENG